MERNLKNLLLEHGFSFKKAFGQNFLTDESLLDEIVVKAGVTKNHTVLEIGCGAGALTKALAKRAKKVIGYEIDMRLKPVLKDVLADCDNTEIVFKDVMKENLSELEKKLGEGYILVANLPYYITTPIVMQFLEKSVNLSAMCIMVQEEVADRFTAKEGTSDYGAITVGINVRGNAQKIIFVPREMFTPAPNVDSAVVKIVMDRQKFASADFVAIRRAVRTGFNNRRKMFINNLMAEYKLQRVEAEELLESIGVSVTARGETLSAKNYVDLSEQLKRMGK